MLSSPVHQLCATAVLALQICRGSNCQKMATVAATVSARQFLELPGSSTREYCTYQLGVQLQCTGCPTAVHAELYWRTFCGSYYDWPCNPSASCLQLQNNPYVP